MDRINLLLKYAIVILLLSNLLLICSGCSKPPLKKEDLFGHWKSQLNEELILNEDSSFIIKNLLLDEFTSESLTGSWSKTRIYGLGVWDLQNNNKDVRLHFYQYSSDDNITKYVNWGVYWSIRGSGLFENRLPWIIAYWKGEECEMSVFEKVE
jgi:hypothetical protein